MASVDQIKNVKPLTKEKMLEALTLKTAWTSFGQGRRFFTSDVVFSAAIATADMYWLQIGKYILFYYVHKLNLVQFTTLTRNDAEAVGLCSR